MDTFEKKRYCPPFWHFALEYSLYFLHNSLFSFIDFILTKVSRPESLVSDLPPEYVPLRRAKANSDATTIQHKPLKRVVEGDRERKWSFPLNLLRKKQERELGDIDSMMSGPSVESNIGFEENAPLLSNSAPGKRLVLVRRVFYMCSFTEGAIGNVKQ